MNTKKQSFLSWSNTSQTKPSTRDTAVVSKPLDHGQRATPVTLKDP